MKESLEKVLAKVRPVVRALRKYYIILIIIFIAGVYGFLINKINSLNSKEPDQSEVSAKLEKTPHLKIDDATIEKIKQLQDNSVEVKALFDSARQNPFND